MANDTLRPDGYSPRLFDVVLNRALDNAAAVEVAGTMWCGKTWTSLNQGRSVSRIGSNAVRKAVEEDPTIALIGDRPHVIDEWQDVPAIWDEVRNAVDEDASKPGQFILTGSSTPRKKEVSHSGAGRIVKKLMRTMSLQETGESAAVVSLAALFEGDFRPQLVQQRLAPIAEMICRGGWPALLGRDSLSATEYLEGYFDALFEVNIEKRGLNGETARKMALSLARNLGTSATLKTLAADVFPDSLSNETLVTYAADYIEALKAFYVIEEVDGWDAPIRSKTRLRTKPKRYFADPSMACALLGITPQRLLEDGQLFGLMFESLCMHDLAVYASVLPHAPRNPLRYYRDSDALEVDAIIELRDGRWGAFEIKLGESKVDAAVASLSRLRSKVAANPNARNAAPSFMAVLVGAGEYARHIKDEDVYVIPLTALGA